MKKSSIILFLLIICKMTLCQEELRIVIEATYTYNSMPYSKFILTNDSIGLLTCEGQYWRKISQLDKEKIIKLIKEEKLFTKKKELFVDNPVPAVYLEVEIIYKKRKRRYYLNTEPYYFRKLNNLLTEIFQHSEIVYPIP